MKHLTRYRLLLAWAYCDHEDKSTKFMLQYMSDVANVQYDTVVNYFRSNRTTKDREKYYYWEDIKNKILNQKGDSLILLSVQRAFMKEEDPYIVIEHFRTQAIDNIPMMEQVFGKELIQTIMNERKMDKW